MKTYRATLRKKIDNLKQSNVKEFWRTLKGNEHICQQNIEFEEIVIFFKNLNSSNDLENDGETEMQNANKIIDDELNSPIIREKILNVLENLKNKTCSEDQIRKVYLKSSAHLLIDIDVKLFNLIFDSGKVPVKWYKYR